MRYAPPGSSIFKLQRAAILRYAPPGGLRTRVIPLHTLHPPTHAPLYSHPSLAHARLPSQMSPAQSPPSSCHAGSTQCWRLRS